MTATLAEPPRAETARPEAVHSPDFSVVVWRGKKFFFSYKQARVVEALWEAMEKGYDVLRATFLMAHAADSDQKSLGSLFRRGKHPAWGSLIVPVPGMVGAYRLAFAGDATA